MSSSNEVQITYIEEATYGETPAVGDFKPVVFTSDGLNAAPETTESAQIRVDRLSSGQVLTGLTVGGDIPVEFSKAQDKDDFFEGAMLSTWAPSAPVAVEMTIDATANTITRSSGDWNAEVAVGDVLILGEFTQDVNNTQVMVMEITSNTVIRYTGPVGMVNDTDTDTTFQVADKIGIGTQRKSYSIEKKFNDLTTRGLVYKGMYLDGFTMTAAYGEIVNGTFNFAGAEYSAADQASELITNGRNILPAATTTPFNGSIDMAFLASSATGAFSGVDFCIQSIEITLANNLTAQNCVGKIGPDNYSLGTAAVNVSLSAYLSDETWQFLDKKLTQESFSLGFIVKNGGGLYAFYIPALQVAFDVPSSAGQNTDIILDMTGVGKVGDNGEKSLYIYKS